MFIPLIMAGGVGERFWPLSRRSSPKQFLSIVSEKTLIEDTVERLSRLAPVENICIATTANQVDLIHTCLPEIKNENIIVEPCLRNTAPCIGLSAAVISQRFGDDTVIGVFPADHVIKDVDIFTKTIHAGAEAAREHDAICQIGIRPTFPSTGYGYIHRGESLGSKHGINIYDVSGFKEKPDSDTAETYIESGEYFWNGGIFVFKPETMLNEMKKYMPDLYKGLKKIRDSEENIIEEVYPGFEKISIDYGIIEKTDKRCVAEALFYWDDVGAWDAVEKHFQKDENDSIIEGDFIGEDCHGSIVFNKSSMTVAGIGLSDMIIVACDDAVLILPKSRAQDVKKIVNRLRKEGKDNLL